MTYDGAAASLIKRQLVPLEHSLPIPSSDLANFSSQSFSFCRRPYKDSCNYTVWPEMDVSPHLECRLTHINSYYWIMECKNAALNSICKFLSPSRPKRTSYCASAQLMRKAREVRAQCSRTHWSESFWDLPDVLCIFRDHQNSFS